MQGLDTAWIRPSTEIGSLKPPAHVKARSALKKKFLLNFNAMPEQ